MPTYSELALTIASLPPSAGSTIIVGLDGGGGAGKSTLAARLAEQIPGSHIVQTDDFASWDNPTDWWPRLIEQVLEPLSRGETARYQRYDWVERRLSEWVEFEAKIVILEGVTALRREFRPFLAYGIWVDCPAELRLSRGLERDGQSMAAQWETWMAAEFQYAADHRPREFANLVIAGNPAMLESETYEVVGTPTVRFAVPDDAVGIAITRNESWRGAYAHILPAKTLAALRVDTSAKRLRTRIEESDRFAVAVLGGEVVGFANWGENHLNEVDAEVQLFALYVRPSAWGHRCGTELVKFVAGHLLQMQITRLSVSLFDANQAAKRFYDRLGAEVIGPSTYHFDGVDYPTESRLWADLRKLVV